MPEKEFSFEFNEGRVFVGDLQFSLAHPTVEFIASDDGDRRLRFHIDIGDADAFTDVWQKCAHSVQQANPDFPVTRLVELDGPLPCHTQEDASRVSVQYFDLQYAETRNLDVQYYELGIDHALKHDVQYADVVYAEVSYAEVSYATSNTRELRQDNSVQSSNGLMTLTISGLREEGKRHVINLDGIGALTVQGGRKGWAEVVVRFVSSIPIDRLIWLIDGNE